MSFYFRTATEDGLAKDEGLTNRLVDEIQQFYPDFPDLDQDKNHDYGILIVNRKILTKRIGTQALIAQMGVTQIAMVGNSHADYVGSDIAVHYAVGDAHQEFQDIADYTAAAPLTRGSVEILRKLCAA
jgi:hydroxymethylpyrimidine pyrophosphatase-like HAD family hydrolase